MIELILISRIILIANLLIFSVITYGLSWLLTKSKLFRLPRKYLLSWPLVGELVHCIVCTSVWVGFLLLWIAPEIDLLATLALPTTWPNVVGWLGYITGSNWIIARLLKDTD